MRKIILSLSSFLFFVILSSMFPSPSFAEDKCIIKSSPSVEYGKEYSISIAPLESGRMQQLPTFPLTIKGVDVNLPDGPLNLSGASSYTLSTELGPGKYDLYVYGTENTGNSTTREVTFCKSTLIVTSSTDPNIEQPTPLPTKSISSVGYEFTSPPDPTTIDGYTPSISILFDGLISSDDYELCFESDIEKCEIGGKKKTKTADINGQISVKNICGDGPSAVKQKKNDAECDVEKDYFHEGSMYFIHLFENDTSSPIISAPFYVKRTYPNISILNNANISVDISTNPYKILINNRNINEISTDNKDLDNRYGLMINNPLNISLNQKIKTGGEKVNNFQIVLEGIDNKYKSESCISLSGSRGENGSQSTYFNSDPLNHSGSQSQLPPGKYLLKVNERINDSTTWRRTDNCQGGFTYYHIPIIVIFENDKENGRKVLNTYVDISNIQADPNESENFYSDSEQNKFGSLPCIEGKTADGDIVRLDPTRNRYENIVECTQYATAIGSFGTDPLGFINTLGTWLFRIATISTFALMIYAGILFQLSRGDKEKVGKAREIITAAITGLIFLILSVSILQIIGIDILKIPGFVREDTVATPTPAPTLPPGRPADRGR